MRRLLVLSLCLTPLAACASMGAQEASVAPNYAAIVGEPAPPQARLYADCLGEAAQTRAYRRAHDPSTEVLLFTCTGEPARAFYDGLAARSAAIGSQFIHEGRTYRSTNRVVRDLFGVDHCSVGAAGDHACVITLNVGEFGRP